MSPSLLSENMARIINKDTGRILTENNRDKQELWCHGCGQYVQFPIDLTLEGNHVLNCPNCDHEHCRVVKNGIITSERWDSRNGSGSATYYIAAYTSIAAVTSTSTSTGWGSSTGYTAPAYTVYR